MSTEYTETAGLKSAMVAGHVPQHIKDELDRIALETERSTSALVRIAVRRYLAEHAHAAV